MIHLKITNQIIMLKLRNETLSFILRRNFSKTSKNLYDVLCIAPGATQADIKASYYKLSKIYHPDMNKDNENAAEKFRLITEAYEVLGNYRLRKLYDKGIIHTAGKDYSHHASDHRKTQAYDHTEIHPDDDQTTKFYKSRLRRPHTPSSQKIYNFDEWTAQHYSDTFNSSKAGRNRYEFKERRNANDAQEKCSMGFSLFSFGVVIVLIVLAEISVTSKKDKVIETSKTK